MGVNKYRLRKPEPVEVRQIDNSAVRSAQIARLKNIRSTRDAEKVKAALAAITEVRGQRAVCARRLG